MTMLNIPSTNVDPQNCYQMPRLISRLEGRGNGIKTCIVNMADVARALNRPPQYATAWFGAELGTQSHYVDKNGDGDLCLIDGPHDISVVQDLLDGFIEKYVCCEDCHQPELDMYITKGVLQGKCKACGWDDELDNVHRVTNFILKHPPDKLTGGKINKKAAKAVELWKHELSDTCDDYDDDDLFFTDTGSSSSDHKLKKEKKDKKEHKEKKGKKDKKDKKEKKEKKDANASTDGSEFDTASETMSPSGSRVKGYGSNEVNTMIKTMKAYVEESGEHMTVGGFSDELRATQLVEVLDNKMMLYVALEALLGQEMDSHSVYERKDYLAEVIDEGSMSASDVLWAFSAYIQAHPSTAKGFPKVLKGICDEDWAIEAEILEYYSSDSFCTEPGFLVAKRHAGAFLGWLSTVQASDEDEDKE